jgi:hypothetical protein
MATSEVSRSRIAQVDRSAYGGLIERIAREEGYDPNRLKAYVSIESGANPRARTGSYKGFLQLSDAEFSRFGDGGDIFHPESNLRAGIRSLREKEAKFAAEFGRQPSPTEVYLMHQQGEAGLRAHVAHPDQPAWRSMLGTGEGRRKGDGWAKLAVWGNVPSDMRARFGSVEHISSKQFIAVWMHKLQGIPYETALASIKSEEQEA